jgi:hypothetical protein
LAEAWRAAAPADVRAVAPALQSLTLLHCEDVDFAGCNMWYFYHGRGAPRRWGPKLDVLDDDAVAAAAAEKAAAEAAEAAEDAAAAAPTAAAAEEAEEEEAEAD